MHLLAKEAGSFDEISVYEASELYGRTGKYRLLTFADGAVQGAMDLKDPRRIVLDYQRAIIHLMEFNQPAFANAFLIGHGIGSIAGRYPDQRFTVAELDEKVIELSRRYFGYSMDNVRVGDGRQILNAVERNTLDYVILDAFTAQGTPHHLTTHEFFRLTREKLSSRGMLIMNLVGKIRNNRLIAAIRSTLAVTYPHTRTFFQKREHAIDANVILIGSSGPIEYDLREMAGFKETEISGGHILFDSARQSDGEEQDHDGK